MNEENKGVFTTVLVSGGIGYIAGRAVAYMLGGLFSGLKNAITGNTTPTTGG